MIISRLHRQMLSLQLQALTPQRMHKQLTFLNTTATGMPKNTNPAVVKPIPAMPIIDTVNGLEYNFLITKQVFLKNFQIFL